MGVVTIADAWQKLLSSSPKLQAMGWRQKLTTARGDLGFGANPIGKECGLTLVFGLGGS